MKRINYLLLIGTVVLIFLMAVSMFPEYFTEVDPYGKQYERLTYEDGKFSGSTPPIAPCEEFPWGTDALGRDLKSLIVYGCKATLWMGLMIALGRLLIALPLSILAAYKNKLAGWLIKEFNLIFSAFPLVIICTFFAQSNVTQALFISKMLPAAIMLTIFGWGRLANIISQKAAEILSQEFIEGEISIGKSRFEIAVQNVLPHLIPNQIILVFLEIALVLVSLAQIGILSTFVSKFGFFDEFGGMNTPLEFDWPSLFIFSYYLFGSDKTWLIIYPALAFAVSIMGFNLFGEGLRLEFERENSKVISFIKKIPRLLSPVRFIYEIKNFREYRSTVIKKSIAVALTLSMLAIPTPQNLYELDAQSAFQDMEVFHQLRGEAMRIPTAETDYAKTLSRKLEEFGVQPFDGKYLHKFITKNKQVLDSSLSIEFDNKRVDLKYLEDYQLEEFAALEGSYDMEIVRTEGIRSVVRERAKELEEKVVALDGVGYFKSNYYIEGEIRPKAFLYIMPKESIFEFPAENRDEGKMNMIWAFTDVYEQLINTGEAKINMKVQTGFKEGVNVIGYIPGCDELLKDEYIVIGSPINYLQNCTKDYRTSEIGGVSIALEIAEAIQKYGIRPKRTIVFAFWGGDKELARGTVDFVNKYFQVGEKSVFYVDLKDLTNMQTNDILVDTSRVMPKSKIGQAYVKALKKYAQINHIKLNYGSIESPYAKDFYNTNRQAMVISSSRKGPIFDKLYQNNGQINEEKFNKAAQMIFNTVIEMAIGGADNE